MKIVYFISFLICIVGGLALGLLNIILGISDIVHGKVLGGLTVVIMQVAVLYFFFWQTTKRVIADNKKNTKKEGM
jgi:hypothetical protein